MLVWQRLLIYYYYYYASVPNKLGSGKTMPEIDISTHYLDPFITTFFMEIQSGKVQLVINKRRQTPKDNNMMVLKDVPQDWWLKFYVDSQTA